MDKTLLEAGGSELVELFDTISQEAKKEKLAIPPINEMLYWWTRKPLVVGRAASVLGTIRNDTSLEDVRYLLGINAEERAFNRTPNMQLYKSKLACKNESVRVLDPFAGSGNLIFEAKR